MQKPISKIAMTLWIAATVVGLVNTAQIYLAMEGMAQDGGTFMVLRAFFAALTGTITPVVMLVGFGWLVELVDQIRWNTQSQT